MLAHVRANVLLLVLTFLVAAGLYPLAVLAVGQGLFPTSASGSIVHGPDGKPLGSLLLAQEFKGAEWFHPRPSAADYNAAASAGSNWGSRNPKLRERAEAILGTRPDGQPMPADAVTASGSGLDPHITRANAHGQRERVIAAWVARSQRPEREVRAVVNATVEEAAFTPLAGLVGGDRLVNVLEVNRSLVLRLGAKE